MTSTIITKNSSTASSVPSSGSLTQGELAVNVTDKKLYTKDSGGTVVKLVGSLGNQEASAAAITGGSINGTTVGASTASTGAFTTLSASSTVSGTGFSTYLASPPAIGGTAAAAGSFTTLSASGAVTLSGGTANGVAYLNGSKVVTSGSALTYSGSTLSIKAGNGDQLVLNNAGERFTQLTLQNNGTTKANLNVDNTNSLYEMYSASGFSLVFSPNASEAMRLTSTGLGIGTSSPAAKLDVTGTFNGTQAVFGNTSGRGLLIGTALNGGVNEGSSVLNARGAGNGQFLFQTDGTLRMTLSDSGNLGLGVTPSAWSGYGIPVLELPSGGTIVSNGNGSTIGSNWYYASSQFRYSTNAAASYYFQSGGAHSWQTAPVGTAGNAITFTQAMTLDASGRLGVGVTSPSYKLQVDGTIAARFANPDVTAMLVQATTGTNAAAMTFNNTGGNAYVGLDSSNGSRISGTAAYSLNMWHEGAYPICFGNNNAERARISSGGDLLVGTTSTSGATGFAFISPSTSSVQRLIIGHVVGNTTGDQYHDFFYNGGSIGSITQVSTTGVLYNTTSDYRLKTVTGAVAGHGERIDALKPVDYLWTESGQQARGFLAHEFQQVYANSVNGTKDAVDENGNPKYQSMQAGSSEVIADLVAEIQSLRKRLADAGI